MALYDQTVPYYQIVDTPLSEDEFFDYEPYVYVPETSYGDPVQQRMFLILAFVVAVIVLLATFVAPKRNLGSFTATGASQAQEAAPAEAAAEAAAAPAVTGGISPLFSPEVRYWEAEILRWAARHGLDPNMVATVMQIESCGDPQAISRAGAQGLFQVMPFHFSAGEHMLDPDTNAFRGMSYLVERLQQTSGDVGKAFAGYNGGHVAAGGSWETWLPETRRYFTWSTGIYADTQAGLSSSPTLDQWMQAGGASLCRQAAGRLGLN